jgi:exopolysaccharide production protein ExoZ
MIWSLQSLRFVAALMVVYNHAAESAKRATGSSGSLPDYVAVVPQAGVDIFFVLSGVIIAVTAAGMQPGEFIWRRFRRVVPIYWVFSVPAVLISVGAMGAMGWRDWLATLLLWPATDILTAPANLVGWTLCFEMLFYASFALVLVDRRWAYALAALFVVSFLLRPFGAVFQFLGNPIILEFPLGVAIASLPRLRGGVWLIALGSAMLLIVGVSGLSPQLATAELLSGEHALHRVVVYGLPAAMIVYGTMQVDAKPSVWTYLGDASYTLYLTHPLIIVGLRLIWMNYPIPPDLIILCAIAASVLFAWRVHELIEKPLLAAMRKPHQLRVTFGST